MISANQLLSAALGNIHAIHDHRAQVVHKPQRGIQSIEVGGRLLFALVKHGQPLALRDLAHQAGMAASKAHRYLVSFGKLGLVKQDPASGAYELGHLALQLGLASLQRLDPLREAYPETVALAAKTGQTVAIAVRGNLGPTVVRIEESGQPLHVNMRPGTVMSLINTATGQVFAAFLPPRMIEKMMDDESVRLAGVTANDAPSAKRLEALLTEVRRRGLARAVGHPIPGINALSAPVFDANGNLVLAMTALGPAGVFDPAWDGEIASALRASAAAVSRRLGHAAPGDGPRVEGVG